jgi:hypothetical protein
MGDDAEIDFFGAHIKVRSAKLAALLNSAVTDDVGVVGKRAIDLVGVERRGGNLRDEDQRDEDLNAALDDDAARDDRLLAADEPHDCLDRMFARPWVPPAQR